MVEHQQFQKRQRKYSEMQHLVDLLNGNENKSEQFIYRINELLDKTSCENGSRSNTLIDLYQQIIMFEMKNQDKYRSLNEQLTNLIVERAGTQRKTTTKEPYESQSNKDDKVMESKTGPRGDQTTFRESLSTRESYSI